MRAMLSGAILGRIIGMLAVAALLPGIAAETVSLVTGIYTMQKAKYDRDMSEAEAKAKTVIDHLPGIAKSLTAPPAASKSWRDLSPREICEKARARGIGPNRIAAYSVPPLHQRALLSRVPPALRAKNFVKSVIGVASGLTRIAPFFQAKTKTKPMIGTSPHYNSVILRTFWAKMLAGLAPSLWSSGFSANFSRSIN